jgi:hypothetical protein
MTCRCVPNSCALCLVVALCPEWSVLGGARYGFGWLGIGHDQWPLGTSFVSAVGPVGVISGELWCQAEFLSYKFSDFKENCA